VTHPIAPSCGSLGPTDDIELRLGADLSHLPVVRAMANSLAIRADFDIDSIADLKLAVDEACSTVIPRAFEGSTMSCRFTLTEHELYFSVQVLSPDAGELSTETFGWRVLSTLTDTVATKTESHDSDGQGQLVRVQLSKRRSVVSA
jgi:serine/threonine-protein kinase RsbW